MQYQYILSLKDLNLCKKKNSKSNQLAFGIMLGYFKEHIQFPYGKEFSISAQLILQISKDLEIDPMHIATWFCRIYFREVWFLHKTEILGVMTPLTF
jgi:hypothetical protein